MTRILTITSWYPPHHYGGYELSCHDVMTRLADRGHDVRVLCGDERLPTAAAPDPAAEARVFRELRPHRSEAEARRPGLRERVAIERHNRRTLERHLVEHTPDVVSVWHMAVISAALLRQLGESGIPVVYVVCDEWPRYVERVDPWTSLFHGGPVRSVAGRVVEGATGLATDVGDLGTSGTFCFVSEFTRQRLIAETRWSYPRSTVVYSGIEPSEFPVVDAPSDRSPGWRLLYVGRLDAWKGVDTLLHALPHLPADATLTCLGRGADRERTRLAALAEKLGVAARVTFGSRERHELPGEYAAADVLVFPSEWPEPFGLVPVEAMACGTPVVATGVGGSSEFLADGTNSVLFPPGDPLALAAAVRRVHDEGELRRRVVEGGFVTAAALGVDRLADTLEVWHVAAANRYADGPPPDRPSPVPAREIRS